MFEQTDEKLLKSLCVKTLLDLALITPKKYEDNTPIKTLVLDKEVVINAEILQVNSSFKLLRVLSFCADLNCKVELLVFHPKFWQIDMFKVKNLFLRGKLSLKDGVLQMSHPRIISQVGEIISVYKNGAKNKSITALMKKYINQENLLKTGIDEQTARLIQNVHHPKTPKDAINQDEKNALKLIEIFNYLKLLSAKKIIVKSSFTSPRKPDIFMQSLPFELTADQNAAINDCYNDLQSSIQKRRVIIGDVGSGKTLVILAIAFMAKKAVLMVPTSILAAQIYEEAQKYLELKTALITTKTSAKIKLDEFDFLIGTHALLYKNLPKVGAIIVDEQHRFGSAQRQALSKLTNSSGAAHYFQFSATPIPRTQALIQSTLVDISLIKQMPFKKDITTKILKSDDFADLIEHIKAQIAQNKQAIIVYPLVEKGANSDYLPLEDAKAYWLKNFTQVYVTHGKDKNKEEVIENFANNGNILLSTTVVEVGISLPRLTVMVIIAPERLGLASLHQLRGRLSRHGAKSTCFLLTKKAPSKRLIDLSQTLDGFEVARLDLENRQSGDILSGSIQSGKIFEWFDVLTDEEILLKAKSLDKNL